MTIHAIAGLTVFNVLAAVAGSGVLHAFRPGLPVRETCRQGGLAFLLGIAGLMVILTACLIVGLPVDRISIAAGMIAMFIVGQGIARRRAPEAPVSSARASSASAIVLSAAVLGLVVVALEAVFRKGRLQPLLGFDEWNSWAPKVKELFYTGHLPAEFLATLAGGSYPPGLPAVLSAGLHASGSADMVTLHLEYWFLAVGFAAALVALLGDRVPLLVLLPFVLLVFVMPDLRNRSVDMYGDLPLGYLVAAGAVLVGLWLEESKAWRLQAAAVLLAGAVLTKREGVLLVACVLFAAALASVDRARFAWPRLAMTFAPGLVLWLAWFLWLRVVHLPGNGPTGGLHFVTDGRRGWDSLVVVTKNLFDYDLWLITATLGVAAVALCLLASEWRAAIFVGSTGVVMVLASTVVIWSDPNAVLQDVNLVSRLVGTVALTIASLTPLALGRAWHALGLARAGPGWRSLAMPAAVAIITIAAVAYPAAVVAGGGARFPDGADCGEGGLSGPPVVVFGHEPSYARSLRLRDRLARSGFVVSVAPDRCGQVLVFAGRGGALSAAQALVLRAHRAGISAEIRRRGF